MFNFKKDIIFRFKLLVLFIYGMWALVIVTKAGFIMFKERDFWNKVRERGIRYNETIPAKRGNILSDNGEVLVSSLVKYRIYIDFDYTDRNNQATEKKVRIKKDSIWNADVRALSEGLSKIIPQWSAKDFETHLRKGMELNRRRSKGRREYPLCPGPIYITYAQKKEIEKLPIMSLQTAYSGLIARDYIDRRKIFGSLAKSTLGDIVASESKSGKKITVKYGLENKHDSLLRGKDGIGRLEKSRLRVDEPAENGVDIQTTLNVELMDICEKALRQELIYRDAMSGWVILMETKTGDIKAIVNLAKVKDSVYVETNEQTKYTNTSNLALCNLMEPGSIFKTVALAAALEDGKIKPNDSVPHHNGKHKFYGNLIQDSHAPSDGRTHYTITEVIMNSSNIGMGEIINNGYKNNPKAFTDKLRELGICTNFGLVSDEATPWFASPARKTWSKADMISLSYGYASMMTSINMVAFYNTIANGGDFYKPRLIKAHLQDGEVIRTFEPQIIKKGALSKETTEALTKMLIEVVNNEAGTGKRAKTERFVSAGKTGTARISKNGTYKYSPLEYLLSFCGFFPADDPQYTCIVQMINNKAPRSGGMTSGVVFKEIAEKIMAKQERMPLEASTDTLHSCLPNIKKGNMSAVSYLVDEMEMEISNLYESDYGNNPQWGVAKEENNTIIFDNIEYTDDIVPNVVGMGAKDALYLMKKAGLEATINGYGKVVAQSLKPGEKAIKGANVTLTLKH